MAGMTPHLCLSNVMWVIHNVYKILGHKNPASQNTRFYACPSFLKHPKTYHAITSYALVLLTNELEINILIQKKISLN